MTIADARARIELDCAHGDLDAPPTETPFNVRGTFVREHGGPVRDGEIPESHPALYAGTVAASTMTLAIRLSDTNEFLGSFTLSRGSTGRVVKCL